MRMRGTLSLAVALSLAGMSPLRAQGTLSTQGLGFPPGQLSTHARTMGGATGETDPISPLNPSAIGLLTAAILTFQAEPEYRQLRLGSQTIKTSISRFPLFMGALPLGSRWTVGLAASTLLDRTFETTTRDSQVVSGDSVKATITQRSQGSITDIRLALAYSPRPWLKLGVGAHAFSGSDVLQTTRVPDDTVRFTTDAQRNTVGFGGNAMSVGALTMFPRRGAIGVSYRRGGTMRAYDGEVVVGSGNAPDHLGVSVVYLGIRGTALAVRAAKDNWSQLRGMTPTLNIHEAWDIGAGADVTGPRFGASAIGLRAGGRWRTLPFSVDGTPVKERTWSGGFVLPMGRFRAVELNFGALHSTRTAASIATEKAWTLSTGFSVRP
jgi:hypothetical protein